MPKTTSQYLFLVFEQSRSQEIIFYLFFDFEEERNSENIGSLGSTAIPHYSFKDFEADIFF